MTPEIARAALAAARATVTLDLRLARASRLRDVRVLFETLRGVLCASAVAIEHGLSADVNPGARVRLRRENRGRVAAGLAELDKGERLAASQIGAMFVAHLNKIADRFARRSQAVSCATVSPITRARLVRIDCGIAERSSLQLDGRVVSKISQLRHTAAAQVDHQLAAIRLRSDSLGSHNVSRSRGERVVMMLRKRPPRVAAR